MAFLHDMRFSDEWIFKRLKNVHEFQPDYANWEYSISSLGEKKVAERRSSALQQHCIDFWIGLI